jgi:hypothetical protein
VDMVGFQIEAVEIQKKKVLKSFEENICSRGHAQSNVSYDNVCLC